MAYLEPNAEVKEMIEKAKAAELIVREYTQEQIDKVVYEIGKLGYSTAEEMATMAFEETGMGSIPGKIGKNTATPCAVWWDLKDAKSVGPVKVDVENQMVYIAKPAGIVSALVPSTNPTVTPISNGMQILKARNAVIFCPHPGAKKSTYAMCEKMRECVASLGCPADIIQCVKEPSTEVTQMVMSASDVVLATGGPGMVRAAYSSGKPSIGVGQGNVQVLLCDDYEDIDGFALTCINARTYDNGLVCTSDQMVHAPRAKEKELIAAFEKNGALYIGDEETKNKLRNLLFEEGGRLNRDIVGNTAAEMCEKLGIEAPEGVRELLVPVDAVADEDYYCREILCAVQRLHLYDDFKKTVDDACRNYLEEGAGHSGSIWTFNQDNIDYAGEKLPVCRLTVNQNAGAGAGRYNNGFPTTSTIGCGYWGGNSIGENFTYKNVMQYTAVSKVIEGVKIPTPQDIFPDLF